MKNTLIVIAIAVCLCAGCSIDGISWDEVSTGAETAIAGAAKTAGVAEAVAPFTGGYGTAVAGIALGISQIASVIKMLADSKKKKALATAASKAADKVPGGGQALVNAATAAGVSNEIREAFEG